MKRALIVAAVAAACSPGGGPKFSGPGPWGMNDRVYGAADGILEQPVIGSSTDEAQNLWVATHAALYLLRPGEKTFHRFVAADGLHLMDNPVRYCDSDFAGGDQSCPIYGAAVEPGISEIKGGAANEVFVGYYGHDQGTGEWDDPYRHTGKLDRVHLQPDGTLRVDRIDLVASNSVQYWHNRTVMRLLYDHFLHPHELYVGTNHGVVRMQPDKFRAPGSGEWFQKVFNEYAADHLHPQVCFHMVCDGTGTGLMLGDWKGLALTKDGDLWVGGRWTGGLISWTAGLPEWWQRPGNVIYKVAFGDPYRSDRCGSGFCNQPIFTVPSEGDTIAVQAVAVTPDGRAFFASGRTITSDTPLGIAAWDGSSFTYFDPVRDAGMNDGDVRDMVALPDGRLALAGNDGVTLWAPSTGAHVSLAGLPDAHVVRLELDQMVDPPTLYVSTEGGVLATRKLP